MVRKVTQNSSGIPPTEGFTVDHPTSATESAFSSSTPKLKSLSKDVFESSIRTPTGDPISAKWEGPDLDAIKGKK